MKKQSLRSIRHIAFVLAGIGITQGAATAQLDATVTSIEVTQGIQSGPVPLTGERATFVRASAGLGKPGSVPVMLDGIMRVFVNGVEAPESPIYSINGPYPAFTSPNLTIEDGTLNFFYLPPISDDVVFTVEINPEGPNFVAEGNTSNNTLSTAQLDFAERAIPEFAYSPIDYRPSGGGANVPSPTLIEPGAGDNFIQGIYPVSDVNYHRTDAPSKLWTGNLSGSGSQLLNSLQAEVVLMNPVPDFLYGWVPGGLPYNGVSFLNSPVSMGNTQTFKYQRTYAHEVGHNVGRQHVSWKIQVTGIDVEHHLDITKMLSLVKASTLNDIMVPGLNTNQAWVRDTNYVYFYNHPKIANVSPPAPEGPKAPGLFLAGIWNTTNGEVELTHVLGLPASDPSTPVAPEQADFMLRAYAGGSMVQEYALAGANTRDSCADHDPDSQDSAQPATEIGFWAVLPEGAASIDRLELAPMDGVEAGSVTLVRSANAPQVAFTSPGVDVSAGQIKVAWTGSDADGDELTYYLRYSHDGDRYIPLATGVTETELDVDLTELPALVNGVGYFQLLASDGLNTTIAQTPTLNGGALFSQGGNDPWVHIVTPDDGKVYNKGTTVFLHSSGWDLEDRALDDSAIGWTSDLDGVIGAGRVTSVATLSVGTHQVTATATDSGGLTSTDTHAITIQDRGLPTSGPETYCTAGTSANGCQASVSSTGTPSATAASGFTLDVAGVEGQKDGQFYYGSNGRQAIPWGNGTSFRCVVPPTKRAGLMTGGGTNGACDGSFSQDMNALWTANPSKNPGAGAVVQAQFWYRDPANTSNQTTSFSDAIEFLVEP